MRSVALMGRAGSGKDSAADALSTRYGHVRVALADPLKAMALRVDPLIPAAHGAMYRLSVLVDGYGWDGAKRRFPEVRGFLQRLGSDGVRDVIGDDTWIAIANRALVNAWEHSRPVVITDVRFTNEVAWARANGLALIWIERPGVTDGEHVSESLVTPADADAVVHNDGSLADLALRVTLAVSDAGAGRHRGS